MTSRLKSFAIAALSTLAVAVLAPTASASLVLNGGFQSGTPDATNFEQVDIGETSISNWSVTAGNIDWIHGYWPGSSSPAAFGDFSVDLSGFNAQATITQNITGLVTGQQYSLTFDTAINPDFDDLPQSLTWTLGTTVGGATLGVLSPFVGWNANIFTFIWTEASTSGILAFSSTVTENCCYGPALDNVALNAVPIPAALPLLAAALGALGFMGRDKKRKAGASISPA